MPIAKALDARLDGGHGVKVSSSLFKYYSLTGSTQEQYGRGHAQANTNIGPVPELPSKPLPPLTAGSGRCVRLSQHSEVSGFVLHIHFGWLVRHGGVMPTWTSGAAWTSAAG